MACQASPTCSWQTRPRRVSYSPTAVLFDSKIFEYAAANELFTKLKESITTLQPWPLTKVGG